MAENMERTPEFEKKVADQEHNTFKSSELDMMTQEEFDQLKQDLLFN